MSSDKPDTTGAGAVELDETDLQAGLFNAEYLIVARGILRERFI